jgi:hypothetical protein
MVVRRRQDVRVHRNFHHWPSPLSYIIYIIPSIISIFNAKKQKKAVFGKTKSLGAELFGDDVAFGWVEKVVG